MNITSTYALFWIERNLRTSTGRGSRVLEQLRTPVLSNPLGDFDRRPEALSEENSRGLCDRVRLVPHRRANAHPWRLKRCSDLEITWSCRRPDAEGTHVEIRSKPNFSRASCGDPLKDETIQSLRVIELSSA